MFLFLDIIDVLPFLFNLKCDLQPILKALKSLMKHIHLASCTVINPASPCKLKLMGGCLHDIYVKEVLSNMKSTYKFSKFSFNNIRRLTTFIMRKRKRKNVRNGNSRPP